MGCPVLATANAKIVLTSFYPIYISTLNVTQNIAGVTVKNLTKPQTGCLHDYQLTPQDLKSLTSADVLIVNGGGMESFIDKAVRQQPNLKIINASKNIDLIKGSGAAMDNPHVWVSIAGAIAQVKNIAAGLAEIDPSNAQSYHTNATVYIDKLTVLQKTLHQQLKAVSSRDIITFHEAFPYFAREFNLNIIAVVEREPGSQPSAGELRATINIIKNKKVTALFAEAQYPATAAQTIARETGCPLYTLDPAVTGPDDLDAYITIMNQNGAVLIKALK